MTTYLKLLLMRHGESLGNVEGRLEGQLSTALSAQGQRQAQQLAAYLQPPPFPTHLYSSPLRRAMETAQVLHKCTGCPLILDPALQELHQGILQGLTWTEARQTYPDVCTRLTTLDYYPVPGAETLIQAQQRAVRWYHTLWQYHVLGDVVWVVSHGGFIQQLIRVILGCDRTWQISIRHTALFEFWLINQHPIQRNQHNPECWKIVKFNETFHLASGD
ncbi:MAG: histidine phosphatase family protein [Symploca sp. SIO2G7]|nr:histidine phosphatase family protein [Symploca sp. SIO2G7]